MEKVITRRSITGAAFSQSNIIRSCGFRANPRPGVSTLFTAWKALAVVGFSLAITSNAVAKTINAERGRSITKYASSRLGNKVGDGQCATLVNYALRANGCRGSEQGPQGPNAHYKWGLKIAESTQWSDGDIGGSEDFILAGYTVRSGDIIQFKNVRFQGKNYWSTYSHHTAIVQSISGNEVKVFHQNVGLSTQSSKQKQRVQQGVLNMTDFTEGTMTFYRPILK